jgi:hypothetical protein
MEVVPARVSALDKSSKSELLRARLNREIELPDVAFRQQPERRNGMPGYELVV